MLCHRFLLNYLLLHILISLQIEYHLGEGKDIIFMFGLTNTAPGSSAKCWGMTMVSDQTFSMTVT